ncbi:hypothetical protein ACQ4LE_000380 [Meloidogyne hapla]
MSDSKISDDEYFDFNLSSLNMQQFFDQLQSGGVQVAGLYVKMKHGSITIWHQKQAFDPNQPVEVFINNAILNFNEEQRTRHRRPIAPDLLYGRAAMVTARLIGPDRDEQVFIKYLPPKDYTIRLR